MLLQANICKKTGKCKQINIKMSNVFAKNVYICIHFYQNEEGITALHVQLKLDVCINCIERHIRILFFTPSDVKSE